MANTKVKCAKTLPVKRSLLLELLRHICGKLPPGIASNPAPCTCIIETVERHHQELSAVLAYLRYDHTCTAFLFISPSLLRTQGAMLWVVVPEALMEWRDYQCWKGTHTATPSLLSSVTSEDDFKEISDRSWTHLLAQIIKVCCDSQVRAPYCFFTGQNPIPLSVH